MDEKTAQKKTAELYSAVNELVKKQDSEISKLSEKLDVKEDVIRNIMREERPVATKRRPSSAFEFYCAQRRIDGADKGEDVDAWLKLSSWDKTMYSQIAEDYNHEQEYETLRYIYDEEKRKHALNQSIKELKNMCRGISQECGYQFLIIGIEPNSERSVAFGTNTINDFCSDKAATMEQMKEDLIVYCLNRKQEQIIDDRERDLSELESTVSSDLKSANGSRMLFTDNLSDHEFNFINDSTSSSISPISPKLTRNNSFDKKREGDMMEYDDDKNFNHLISKDVCDVNLESTDVRSMVYRYLENKFRRDTKQETSIPYNDWKKQENFLISGWPRNVEFKEWDSLNIFERKKVFTALNRLQFHVRLDSDLSKERRASKKKRFV